MRRAQSSIVLCRRLWQTQQAWQRDMRDMHKQHQQQQQQEIQASGMGSLPYHRGSHLCDALQPRGLCRTTLEHPSKVLKLP